MSFSIFHSKQAASSANSKILERWDVDDEAEVELNAEVLIRRGHKINGVIENFEEVEQDHTSHRRTRR